MDTLNALIEMAKEDTLSLEILINQFKPMILKAARTYCYNTDLYSDAVSEGTVALIKCIKKYPTDSKIPFPFYAKRAVYSHIRFYTSKEISRGETLLSLNQEVKRSENVTIEETISSEDTLEDEFFKRYTTLKILETIEGLTPIEKEVMERHYFLGHTLKEIAEDTGYTYRGIKYVKTRGVNFLKAKLKSHM